MTFDAKNRTGGVFCIKKRRCCQTAGAMEAEHEQEPAKQQQQYKDASKGFMKGLLLHMLSRPNPIDERNQKLKERVRKHIAAMIPRVDDEKGEPGFSKAETIMRREALVTGFAQCMVNGSDGFTFRQDLEPAWYRSMLEQKIAIYTRPNKEGCRIFMRGTKEKDHRSTFGDKPYVRMTLDTVPQQQQQQ